MKDMTFREGLCVVPLLAMSLVMGLAPSVLLRSDQSFRRKTDDTYFAILGSTNNGHARTSSIRSRENSNTRKKGRDRTNGNRRHLFLRTAACHHVHTCGMWTYNAAIAQSRRPRTPPTCRQLSHPSPHQRLSSSQVHFAGGNLIQASSPKPICRRCRDLFRSTA
jgi:hypothetical protein